MIVIRKIEPPPDLQPRLLDAPPAPRECDVSSNGSHSRVPASTYANINYPGKALKPFCAWCGQELPEVEDVSEADRRNAAIESERIRIKRSRSVDRLKRRISQSSIASKRERNRPERRGLFDGIDG